MYKNLDKLFDATGQLDNKSKEFLLKALQKNESQEFSYLKFKQSLAALAELGMDEATAFKSAFATASTMGVTQEKLLQTANTCHRTLEKEKIEFDKALQNQLHQRVDSKRKEIDQMKDKIAEYRRQIEELEAKIEKSQHTIDNADNIIAEAKQKILDTQKSFENTYQSLTQQIQNDITNIQNYL